MYHKQQSTLEIIIYIYIYIYIIVMLHTPKTMYSMSKKVIYWCVAYLPSEASIVEH
jgi:hypothetical protein